MGNHEVQMSVKAIVECCRELTIGGASCVNDGHSRCPPEMITLKIDVA